MFLHSWLPQSVLLSIGGLTIHWYGLLLALGALGGYWLVRWLAARYTLSPETVFDLFFLFLVFGFLGARLYHVTNEWSYYGAHPSDILKIWNGGLAIHGAMLSGIAVLILYARRKKLSAWLLADIAVPGLALGQAVGRWGNYFNQELFGRPTNLPWGIPIDFQNRPAGFENSDYFHPTFLYESLGALVIAGILVWLHVRRTAVNKLAPRWLAPGSIALLYFILYSAVRIGMESLRIDRVPVIGGVRLPLLTSLIIIVLAGALWLYRWRLTSQSQRP